MGASRGLWESMTSERRKILNMMVEGKVNAAEADALLDALAPGAPASMSATTRPRYLRVLVEGETEGNPNKVNVRIPLELIRAGMRLAALLPVFAYEPVNRALRGNGINVDISKLRAEDLEALVAHLQQMEIDVDDGPDKVRVFCE